MSNESPNSGPPLTRTTVVVASLDQTSSMVGAEAIILGMTDGVYYGLDGVGARIWDLIQTPKALGVVVDSVVAEFDVEPDRAWSDLVALLEELIVRGLVDRDPPPRA